MPFTVAGQAISRGVVSWPWVGVWTLEASLLGGTAPAERQIVELQLGDVTAIGTVRRSGVEVGRAEVLVVGGRDGWAKTLPRRPPYRRDAGVPLRLVVEDLARDVGERARVLGDLAGVILGYAWTRPVFVASSALRMIRVGGAPIPWWMAPDGTTRFGARELVTPQRLELVAKTRPAERAASVSTPDDRVSALLPGTILELPGLPRGPIRSCEIHITADSVSAEVRF
ncbi:MAG: hypothetical protein IT372_42640 [Polyangiaceae bacterium]|nr:hypothetical protein [Polyangiaceae bacterium]